jgi:hypothetical protein
MAQKENEVQNRISRPPVGDPERAARLREIALKAAAKRKANLAAGIAPKSRRTVKAIVDGVKRFLRIPVMDELATVTECEHSVADLLEVVRIARGEDKQPVARPKRFYCAGCIAVGRSGNPDRHHANPAGVPGVRCESPRCACLGFVQGREFVEAAGGQRGRADIPKSITVNGKTYAYLGNGASRVAYDLGCGKCVLKTLHKTNVGWGANAMPFQAQAECDFYEQTNDADRIYLAAIFARTSDYSTSVVEKVQQQAPDDGAAAMRAFAARKGIRDLHDANVGWRNGRMVILDFGFAPGEAVKRAGF